MNTEPDGIVPDTIVPDAIVPDSKDWTWVLSQPCPDCGWDSCAVPGTAVAALIRANAARWPRFLEASSASNRPDPATWSALEYGCHVRDVLRIADERLRRMLAQPDPLFANWDQDQTAVADRYGEQDPVAVAGELTEAGDRFADHLDQVGAQQWRRTGRRSDGAAFTVESFAQYLLHDPVHHLWDVQRH